MRLCAPRRDGSLPRPVDQTARRAVRRVLKGESAAAGTNRPPRQPLRRRRMPRGVCRKRTTEPPERRRLCPLRTDRFLKDARDHEPLSAGDIARWREAVAAVAGQRRACAGASSSGSRHERQGRPVQKTDPPLPAGRVRPDRRCRAIAAPARASGPTDRSRLLLCWALQGGSPRGARSRWRSAAGQAGGRSWSCGWRTGRAV